MTYAQAIKESKSRKTKLNSYAELAQIINIVAHPAHNKEMIYQGALIQNKTAREVHKMSSKELSDLMFIGIGI